jgi:hypothetical protein
MTTGGMLDRTAIRLTKQVCNVERTIDGKRNHGMPRLQSCPLAIMVFSSAAHFTHTLAYGCIGALGMLCNFAHLFRSIFPSPGLRDAKINSDEARRESHCQRNRSQCIIATAASRYRVKRRVSRKNGTDASSKQAA